MTTHRIAMLPIVAAALVLASGTTWAEDPQLKVGAPTIVDFADIDYGCKFASSNNKQRLFMTCQSSYAEQWDQRLGNDVRRFRVRVRPATPGTWPLRPQSQRFEPCLVFWAMCPMPDKRLTTGISYRTVWLAFQDPPNLHAESDFHDGEAIIVNDEPVLYDVVVPGFRFSGTVDGETAVVEVEVLNG